MKTPILMMFGFHKRIFRKKVRTSECESGESTSGACSTQMFNVCEGGSREGKEMSTLNKPNLGGSGANQYKAAISGSLCYTIMGTAIAWPSPVLIKMAAGQTPVSLDNLQVSWMVSMMFLGHILSPIPSGYFMDMFGRKNTCLCMSVLPFVSWLLVLVAHSPAHLYLARFAAGLWIGVTTTIMPIYVGEIAGPKLRNSLTTINNLLLNFGVLFAYVIGPFVTYYKLALACEALTVIYFCFFFTMPESPHYLLKQRQRDRAYEALIWLREGDSKESIEDEIRGIEKSVEEQRLNKGSMKDIFFHIANRKAFIISITYAILKRTAGSGVLQAYASITLPKKTFGVLDPDTCVIIIGVISLLSSLASTVLAARYHRRTLMTVSGGGCALATAAVMVWFYLNSNSSVSVSNYSDIIFLSFALYFTVLNVGIGPIGTSIKGEMFAPNVKALSSSLTTLVVAFSAFFMNKFYLVVADSFGMYVNYLIYSVSCVLAVVFTWCYLPDTQNKTLEEIQQILLESVKHKQYKATST